MKKNGCPHLKPYADVRDPTADDFTSTRKDGTLAIKPHGLHYYRSIGRCQGTKRDGKMCNCARMMENKYLPLTRFRLPDGSIFPFGKSTWKNPVHARTPADCIRAAFGDNKSNGQIFSPWHNFWHAVDHLSGAHVSGLQRASQGEVDQWVLCIQDKLNPDSTNFDGVKNDFEKAGLLQEGGPGDGEAGVRAKFLLAEKMIKDYKISSAPKRVKRQRSAGGRGRGAAGDVSPPNAFGKTNAATEDGQEEEEEEEEEDAGTSRAETPSKRLKTNVKWAAASETAQYASLEQGLPTPLYSRPLPRDNEREEGVLIWQGFQHPSFEGGSSSERGSFDEMGSSSDWVSSGTPFSDWEPSTPEDDISFVEEQDSMGPAGGSAQVLILLYLASTHCYISSVLILLYIKRPCTTIYLASAYYCICSPPRLYP